MEDLRQLLQPENNIKFRIDARFYRCKDCNLTDFDKNLKWQYMQYSGDRANYDIMIIKSPKGEILWEREPENKFKVELI